MGKSNDLFQLVQSLNGSEKRYIKLTISVQKGEKDYLKLLEAYEKLPADEEEPDQKIKKKFKGTSIERRLSANKNYLYQQILRSLHLYNKGKSLASRVNETLEYAELLISKRLHRQAMKLLVKAKKQARKHHLPLQELRINQLEVRIEKEEMRPSEFSSFLMESYEASDELTRAFQEKQTYEYLLNRIKAVNKSIKSARTEKERALFHEIIEHPAMQTESPPVDVYSRLFYHNVWVTYYHAIGDHENAQQHARQQLETFEADAVLMEEERSEYITTVGNFLMTKLHQRDYDDYLPWIAKLKAMKGDDIAEEVKLFMNAATYEMVMYLATGHFHKGLAMVDEVREGLQRYENKISTVESLIMRYNIAYLYFGSDEFKQSLRFVNQLINEFDKDLRLDVHCAARLIQILIHFELGNSETVVHLANATRRFLKKEERNYQFEELFLNFFRKNAFALNRYGDRKVAFTELLELTEPLTEDAYERQVFDYFDYISYFTAKIENQSFSLIVRGRHGMA